MDSKKSLTVLLTCFLPLISLHPNLTSSSSTGAMRTPCHDEERDALLQLKHSFFINEAVCAGDPLAFPKTTLWNFSKREKEGGECWHCSWDGVECDPRTGRVVSLDLGSSCLYGSIDSSSSLFHLLHLRRLNLGNNDFNHSLIPSGLGRLSKLTHLNLSLSSFSGQIPTQVLELTKLVSLDLRGNPSTILLNPGLRSLVHSLSSLQVIGLSEMRISSPVPDILANISSLSSLWLRDCGLFGEFPRAIFHLPNLRSLSVRHNPYLTGFLPEFHVGSPLQELLLANTSFHGKLPSSMGSLGSLNSLDISSCRLSGSLPASMANLTQLQLLDLSHNRFGIQELPTWLGKLFQLAVLNLQDANLTGQLPHWLGNLTLLTQLEVSENTLQGPIPNSLFQMTALETLNLFRNNLSGVVEIESFMQLKNLTEIDLSDNKLSVLTNTNNNNATSRQWKRVGLGSCNLPKFPDFLRGQNELEWLELSDNHLRGPVPNWFWNTSTEILEYLNLESNFLTKSVPPLFFLPWKSLEWISLANNRLQGFLPIPPPSCLFFYVSNNSFSGNIPQQFCDLISLSVLNVANNNLSGNIPPCIWSSSSNLASLNFRGNNFHGTIPNTFKSGCQLRGIDLSHNHLQGKLPRSLANCVMLEILDFSYNHIDGNFPYWLGALPNMKVLVLRSNRFHGTLKDVGNGRYFPKIHIIDLSCNDFCGNLTPEYFQNWNAMKLSNKVNLTYLSYWISQADFEVNAIYDTKVMVKGVELTYAKIPDALAVIDLSYNRFDGEIPRSIAELKGLYSLNLSGNYFMSLIPPSLGNLTELESLDLSHNKFSGHIPVELAQLPFLEVFNASYNNLSGPIPRGRQFDTFLNTSYLGNSKLCGNPLTKQCENSVLLLPTHTPRKRETDSDSGFEFNWVVISVGYLSGLVIGGAIGKTLTRKKHEWFMDTFGGKEHRKKKRR